MKTSDSPALVDVEALHALRGRLQAAENAGDADTIAGLLGEDAVLMVPSEPVQEGRAASAAFVRRMLAETLSYFDRHIVYTSAEVLVAGDVAFDRGTFEFTVRPRAGGETSHSTGKYLWVYSRSADGWKLARVIVSLDEEEEPDEAG